MLKQWVSRVIGAGEPFDSIFTIIIAGGMGVVALLVFIIWLCYFLDIDFRIKDDD